MPQYQEKNKNKLPKSGYSWYYRCYYTDMYGNRKQKQSKMYPSKTLAKDAEMEFLRKIKTTDEVDYNIRFEYAYNDWLSFKKEQVKATTYYRLKTNLDKHILEYFKSFKLHDIKKNILDNWKQKLHCKNISVEYQNKIIGYMKELLKYCVESFAFDIKVVAKLQTYRIDKPMNKINNSKINFWTLEEFNNFIEYVDNEFDKLMYIFLYYTGLRLGEMIALTWNDISLERKELIVTKSFTNKIFDNPYDILSPKTTNSVRKVDLTDALLVLLKKHKENETKLYGFNEDMFIFGNIKHIAPTTFARHLEKWIGIAKVKPISPHGFRHSHASLLIYLGCDSRDVADRLGDTVEMVERTYAHLFPEKRKITLEKLNNL